MVCEVFDVEHKGAGARGDAAKPDNNDYDLQGWSDEESRGN